MQRFVTSLWQAFLSVVLPRGCAACGAPLAYDANRPLCDECAARVRLLDGLVCVSCGAPLMDGGAHCFRCRREDARPIADLMRGAVAYDGPIRTIVHRLKFGGCPHLAQPLATYLVRLYREVLGEPRIDLVCGVPLAYGRRIVRGYNQADLIARAFAQAIGAPFVRGLHRNRATRAQARLGRDQRFANVRNAFSVRLPAAVFRDKTVAVIDDVCTTGQTLDQCARVLRTVGAARVYCLAAARDGARKWPRSGGEALDKLPRLL